MDWKRAFRPIANIQSVGIAFETNRVRRKRKPDLGYCLPLDSVFFCSRSLSLVVHNVENSKWNAKSVYTSDSTEKCFCPDSLSFWEVILRRSNSVTRVSLLATLTTSPAAGARDV